MRLKVLIDADAFIGLKSADDALHATCKQLVAKLQKNRSHLFTTFEVVIEAATKIRYSLSYQDSVEFLHYLKEEQVIIYHSGRELSHQAMQRFEEIKTKNFSLTDAVNMVVADELEIDTIFSFDKIYRKNNYPLLVDKFK